MSNMELIFTVIFLFCSNSEPVCFIFKRKLLRLTKVCQKKSWVVFSALLERDGSLKIAVPENVTTLRVIFVIN